MSSILNDTKKILGLGEDYTPFDLDVTTHINTAFSVIDQLGIGPDNGIFISDDGDEWEDLGLPQKWTNMLRTYVYLKVKMLFDPPTTSFLVTAVNDQIKEYEWRLSHYREYEMSTGS